VCLTRTASFQSIVKMSNVKFKSFSSGSCGNCYLIGIEEDGVMLHSVIIDAGVSLRRFKKELQSNNIPLDSVEAILVTHDHMDHIRSLGSFCKYLKLPVWATSELHEAMSYHTYTLEHLAAVRKPLAPGSWNEIIPEHIYARYFVVPHDATQTVGYGIKIDGYRFVIMTDIGSMTSEALSFAANADTVVIESNYDVDMLMGGPYTYDLKMRICKGNGHLSNDLCAQAIRTFHHESLKHIYLCHLSENNNTPQLAYASSCEALQSLGYRPSYEGSSLFENEEGETLTLVPLPRRSPSPLYTL